MRLVITPLAEQDLEAIGNHIAQDDPGFEVLVSTGRNLEHQQYLAGRRIAVVVVLPASWPRG